MEQVVPGSIVYSDLKPEAITNDVKLIKYYPTSNVNGYQPNDIVRFELKGNGFFDPYSSYIYFEVEIPEPTAISGNANQISGQFLDRSAHSLIQRFVARSEGTELERLENYDVLAAMINDMIYTNDMKNAHHFEGMTSFNCPVSQGITATTGNHTSFPFIALGPDQGSEGAICNIHADVGHYKCASLNSVNISEGSGSGQTTSANAAVSAGYRIGSRIIGGNVLGGAKPSFEGSEQPLNQIGGSIGNSGAKTFRFCVPIYSGVIGLMMPEKKMLPLSYVPLELEFTLNPYAFYSVGKTVSRNYTVKKMEIHSHVISFEHEVSLQLDSVVARQGLFIPFESYFQASTTVTSDTSNSSITQTIPINAHFKSITSMHTVIVPSGFETNPRQRKLNFVSGNVKSYQVRNGINYMPSLPIRGVVGDQHNGDHSLFYIEMLKSWNRLHDHINPAAIKPYNYCINQLQAFGEPLIYTEHTNTSAFAEFETTPQELAQHWRNIGQCQYGISFQGEELGKDQTTLTGKRGLTPFDLELEYNVPQNTSGTKKNCYFITYVRADFILYVRPDLVVTILGK